MPTYNNDQIIGSQGRVTINKKLSDINGVPTILEREKFSIINY